MQLAVGLAVSFLLSTTSALAADSSALSPQAQAAALQQLQEQLPPCAVQCLTQLVPLSGCEITDTACICTNQNLNDGLAGCLGGNCTVVEALEAQRFQTESCGAPERSQQGQTIGVAWGLWCLTIIAVAGRFATRSERLGGAGYGWDDWTILGVEGVMTAITVVAYLMIVDGLGKDMWMLEPENITSVLRYFWVEEVLYNWCVTCTKISIVLFYLRIFTEQVSSHFRTICWIFIGALTATAIVFTIVLLNQCRPLSYSWTLWDGQHEGTCINSMAQIYAGAGINITWDLAVFFLPIPRLIKVQISARKKVGICITFLVGLFVTVCSIVRLVYLIQWHATTNPTWTYSPIALWSLVECDVGIVCACMPALAGPIKRFWIATVGQPLSKFYASRAKTPTSGSTLDHSRKGSQGWRTISRPTDSKPSDGSIMCNVSLNVSDEVELVGKDDKDRRFDPAQDAAHNYRQRW